MQQVELVTIGKKPLQYFKRRTTPIVKDWAMGQVSRKRRLYFLATVWPFLTRMTPQPGAHLQGGI